MFLWRKYRGDSYKYPQHVFVWRTDKKNYPSIIIKYPPCLLYCIIIMHEPCVKRQRTSMFDSCKLYEHRLELLFSLVLVVGVENYCRVLCMDPGRDLCSGHHRGLFCKDHVCEWIENAIRKWVTFQFIVWNLSSTGSGWNLRGMCKRFLWGSYRGPVYMVMYLEKEKKHISNVSKVHGYPPPRALSKTTGLFLTLLHSQIFSYQTSTNNYGQK